MTKPRALYHPDLWQRLHEKSPEDYPAVDNVTLREMKADEIRKRYGDLMAQVVKPYRAEERETWFTQLKEADEWLADHDADVPMLSAMATARSITVAEMVAKVKGNDALFRQGVGTLLGMQQDELDALYSGDGV